MNAASGELGDGDNPAKKRAVSSAVANAKLCTGAALSASTSVVRMAIIVRSINDHTICDDRDPFKAAKRRAWLLFPPGTHPGDAHFRYSQGVCSFPMEEGIPRVSFGPTIWCHARSRLSGRSGPAKSRVFDAKLTSLDGE